MLRVESLKDGIKISEIKSPYQLRVEQVGANTLIETSDTVFYLNNISTDQVTVKKDDNKNVIIINQEEGK